MKRFESVLLVAICCGSLGGAQALEPSRDAGILDGGTADAGSSDAGPQLAQGSTAGEDLADKAPGVAVVFRNETLMVVHAPAGKLNPVQRAAAIEARLSEIAAGPSTVLQAVRTVERADATDLLAGDALVVSVRDADAAPLAKTRQQLATAVAGRVRVTLQREFDGRSLRGLLLAGAYCVLATLILVLLLFGVRAMYGRLQATLTNSSPRWIPTLHIGSVPLLTPERIVHASLVTLRRLRMAIVLLAIGVYLNTVLSFFPWTRGFAEQVGAYVLGALFKLLRDIVGYLPNLVYLTLIVLFTRWVLKLLKLAADELKKGTLSIPSFPAEWADPTYKIVRFLVLALAAVAAFPYLPGSKSPAFQGISIFVGVLFSLGSSSAIGNIIAGIAMTYMRPFAIGDRVQISDTVGDVIETGLLVVRIRSIKNVEITIANSMVLGNHIINYSAGARRAGLILHTSVTIGYDAPWRQVHELLIAAARSTEGILESPAPFVLQTALSDFYVGYEINAYTAEASQMAVIYSRLHAQIQDHFNAAGVEIMSSHYLNLRDGNAVTIPDAQKPTGYQRPPFRFSEVPQESPARANQPAGEEKPGGKVGG